MPKNSQRIYSEQKHRFSKIANVPADYAYRWLTDYRQSDQRFTRSRPKYRVVKVGEDRIVRIRVAKRESGSSAVAVDLVRLESGNRWHTDQIDETDLATVDYKVTSLGRSRSRIDLTMIERWMTKEYPTPSEFRKSINAFWDRIVEGLDADYRDGRPAVG